MDRATLNDLPFSQCRYTCTRFNNLTSFSQLKMVDFLLKCPCVQIPLISFFAAFLLPPSCLHFLYHSLLLLLLPHLTPGPHLPLPLPLLLFLLSLLLVLVLLSSPSSFSFHFFFTLLHLLFSSSPSSSYYFLHIFLPSCHLNRKASLMTVHSLENANERRKPYALGRQR